MNTGLELRCLLSCQEDEIICLIRAPVKTLAIFADKIDHKMLLDKDECEKFARVGDETVLLIYLAEF